MFHATTTRALIVIGATLLLGATVARAESRCFTAEIPQTIVLPDGSTRAPGALSICREREISPASILHTGAVAGRSVGMFLGSPREIEMHVDEGTAQFVFKRVAGNELELIGYAANVAGTTTFHDIAGYGTRSDAFTAGSVDTNGFDETVILIAAGR